MLIFPRLKQEQLIGLAFVLVLHGVGLYGLWRYKIIPTPDEAVALMVNFINPPAPELPKPPEPEPPKPRPIEPPPPQPVQLAVEIPTVSPSEPAVYVPPPEPVVTAPPVTPVPQITLPSEPEMLSNELAVMCTNRTVPYYPLASKRLNEQGKAILRVELSEEGKVSNATVKKSSGFARLDDAALAAVKTWRCKPAMQKGVAVTATALQSFNFSLSESE
ncbi:MAG: energy transducer TonB [Gallionella sp.]